jgi:leader peptidase (prepilin peptidase)/N-methyltransferase
MPMLVYYWLFVVFVVGAMVGSFLNVVIARLPLEKTVLWPGSRCGSCLQPIRWYHNLPLISYWWLRGRCPSCGASFSIQYFLVELLTALGFVALFYLEVVRNVHGWPTGGRQWAIAAGFYPYQWWFGFGYHALLFSFLMAASVCDLNGREIPFRLTLTGTVIGLVGAVLMPWPWPWAPAAAAMPVPGWGQPAWAAWGNPALPLAEGIYPWPVWGPLPAWLPPGSWQTGLATGLVGMLVGTFLFRAVGFLFSKGLGKEALGLGDADLMMMVGAFLGWQIVVVAFFVSVIPALVIGVFQIVVRGDNSLPFGPSLAAGTLIAYEGWQWCGNFARPVLFWHTVLLFLIGFGAIFMFVAAFLLGLRRRSP